MMKMEMADAINAYDACETILEKDINSDLAFRLAEMMRFLRDIKDSFNVAVSKVKRLENGKLDPTEFNALCFKEIDVNIPEITATEIKKEFEKIPTKVILNLLPVLIRDDKEPEPTE